MSKSYYYLWVVLVIIFGACVFYNLNDYDMEWIVTWILISMIGVTLSDKEVKG